MSAPLPEEVAAAEARVAAAEARVDQCRRDLSAATKDLDRLVAESATFQPGAVVMTQSGVALVREVSRWMGTTPAYHGSYKRKSGGWQDRIVRLWNVKAIS